MAYDSQAEVALVGLSLRFPRESQISSGIEAVLLQILKALVKTKGELSSPVVYAVEQLWMESSPLRDWMPQDTPIALEFAQLTRRLADRLGAQQASDHIRDVISALHSWADSIERAIAEKNA